MKFSNRLDKTTISCEIVNIDSPEVSAVVCKWNPIWLNDKAANPNLCNCKALPPPLQALYKHYVDAGMHQSNSELSTGGLFTDIVRYLVANENDNCLTMEQ